MFIYFNCMLKYRDSNVIWTHRRLLVVGFTLVYKIKLYIFYMMCWVLVCVLRVVVVFRAIST